MSAHAAESRRRGPRPSTTVRDRGRGGAKTSPGPWRQARPRSKGRHLRRHSHAAVNPQPQQACEALGAGDVAWASHRELLRCARLTGTIAGPRRGLARDATPEARRAPPAREALQMRPSGPRAHRKPGPRPELPTHSWWHVIHSHVSQTDHWLQFWRLARSTNSVRRRNQQMRPAARATRPPRAKSKRIPSARAARVQLGRAKSRDRGGRGAAAHLRRIPVHVDVIFLRLAREVII